MNPTELHKIKNKYTTITVIITLMVGFSPVFLIRFSDDARQLALCMYDLVSGLETINSASAYYLSLLRLFVVFLLISLVWLFGIFFTYILAVALQALILSSRLNGKDYLFYFRRTRKNFLCVSKIISNIIKKIYERKREMGQKSGHY